MPDNREYYFAVKKRDTLPSGYEVFNIQSGNRVEFDMRGTRVHIFGTARLAKMAISQAYPRSFIVRGWKG